jgi:hypothetical protein
MVTYCKYKDIKELGDKHIIFGDKHPEMRLSAAGIVDHQCRCVGHSYFIGRNRQDTFEKIKNYECQMLFSEENDLYDRSLCIHVRHALPGAGRKTRWSSRC